MLCCDVMTSNHQTANMSKVQNLPGVYIGGAESAKNAAGFTAIVNCAPGRIHITYDKSVKYIECDVCYDGILPLAVENFIERAIDIGGRVLIHCETGDNLSAVVALAYYMNKHDVSADTAMYQCHECRLTSDYFVEKLDEFDDARNVKKLMDKVSELESELIVTKRRIAVIQLDCDYEHLTLADLEEMKKNGQKLIFGLTSDEKSKKYCRIDEKYREKKYGCVN